MTKSDIWYKMHSRVMTAYRASVQESAGVRPNLLNFGRELKLTHGSTVGIKLNSGIRSLT